MVWLYALTVFFGSSLLFMVQPMVARMLLPRVGGAPALWNTCMLFFQALLLAGYAYAHLLPARLGVRRHARLHGAVILLPLVVLPLSLPTGSEPPAGGDPTGWLLVTLGARVALPFFALATGAPLVQRWYAERASDPSRLYAASNLGSLLALIAYPLAIEPALRLAAQSSLWSVGYGLFAVMTLACIAAVPRAVDRPPSSPETVAASPAHAPHEGLRWVALAFVPSSLMLGVNTYLATDVAAIPLLWVAPLAIYLGSFVYVFARPPRAVTARTTAPFLGLLLLLFLFTAPHVTVGYLLGALHLALCALGCVIFHGELVRLRPEGRRLTAFYLALALGGALGGVFNSLVAPWLFHRVSEYPLTMALAVWLLPRAPPPPDPRERQAAFVRAMGMNPDAVLGLATTPRAKPYARALDGLVPLGVAALTVSLFHAAETARSPSVVRYGVPLMALVLLSVGRRSRLALGLVAIVAASHLDRSVLHESRTFYGVLRVEEDSLTRRFLHGTTLHGLQARAPAWRAEPLSYYDRRGPIGHFFEAMREPLRGGDVGVVGLGVGMLLAHAQDGQRWTYYELDAGVVRVAREYFTWISDARAPVRVVVGDARRALREDTRARYRLLVLDAFSSDAIPAHLVTREALGLYLRHLDARGVVAFHVTNRYVRLDDPLAALARDAGLVAMRGRGKVPGLEGSFMTTWVVMARRREHLDALARDDLWAPLDARPGALVWTDDHVDLLSALKNPLRR